MVQAFETLAGCEEARGREYGKTLDALRRVGAGLEDAQRVWLWLLLDSDPSERQSVLREMPKDPRLNEALDVVVAATIIRNSVCVASNDPRVRNSPMLSMPPLPPATEKPIAKGRGTIRYTPGRPILVTVRLNARASARLILDTGADSSVIKPLSLLAAGVDLTRPVARGEIRGVGERRRRFISRSIRSRSVRSASSGYESRPTTSVRTTQTDFLDETSSTALTSQSIQRRESSD